MACDDSSGGVPLLNWIQRRRLQRNIDNTGGEDDNDYLMLQLRIACSLADQICTAEEEAGLLPTPSSDWINSITVYLQANNNNEEDKHQWKDNSSDSLGSHEPNSDDNFNIENIFNELIHDDAPLAAETEGAIIHTQEVLAGDSNCIRVEMLPSLFRANNEEQDVIKKSMVQRIIHSLAIVFYELFSGGERPAAAQSSQTNNETTADQSQVCFENLDPLPFDKSVSIDVGEELGRILNTDDNLSGGGDIEVDNLSNRAPRKKHTQIDDHVMCGAGAVSSVEPLKAKGLPLALCDLIANMLGCINGNLSGEDAYQTMSEVRDDLQLMLDKPAIYLYDQDMILLSNAGGLQFGETMFGRNAELSSMKDAYRRSVSGDNELVSIISGPSGSGKTLLAYEFGNHVILDGGMFLSGKFDQLQQGKPFSALASAFNQHCDILLQNSALAPTREKFANEVKSSLGSDAYLLAILIPNLATILGLQVFDNITPDIDCNNAQQRLQYLLCCFVDVMCSVFTAPVALFLDDLQ